ncbi:MAG TPA: GNAT family N-acetyltransferase [Solirubrobacterales bacterium]|nr:GNAT family N-acetyltransferase [Solirubrobacterales bacterium]
MEIETERLILRPLALADLDALVELQAEPEVSRFMGAYGRAELSAWVGSVRKEWASRGHGRMAIVERGSGRFVGRTGMRHWPEFDEVELGWALSPEVRGRGYATEAAGACLEWGLRELEVEYVTAMIDPDNSPSIAVAERLGMQPLREDVLLGDAVIIYATAVANRPPGSAS